MDGRSLNDGFLSDEHDGKDGWDAELTGEESVEHDRCFLAIGKNVLVKNLVVWLLCKFVPKEEQKGRIVFSDGHAVNESLIVAELANQRLIKLLRWTLSAQVVIVKTLEDIWLCSEGICRENVMYNVVCKPVSTWYPRPLLQLDP